MAIVREPPAADEVPGIDQDLYEVLVNVVTDTRIDLVRSVELGDAIARIAPVRIAFMNSEHDQGERLRLVRDLTRAESDLADLVGASMRLTDIDARYELGAPGNAARRIFSYGAFVERRLGGPIAARPVEAATLTAEDWRELALAWNPRGGKRLGARSGAPTEERAGHWRVIAQKLALIERAPRMRGPALDRYIERTRRAFFAWRRAARPGNRAS